MNELVLHSSLLSSVLQRQKKTRTQNLDIKHSEVYIVKKSPSSDTFGHTRTTNTPSHLELGSQVSSGALSTEARDDSGIARAECSFLLFLALLLNDLPFLNLDSAFMHHPTALLNPPFLDILNAIATYFRHTRPYVMKYHEMYPFIP